MVTDDVDLESLQAQIDTTMSFAHHLVESWIKPIHRAHLGSGDANVSQILEEGLHRPPRLGVGASIPSAPPLAHDASKLKRRLGKHGTRDEDVVESHPQESENEEHKGRPSKRKVQTDPFGCGGSKKKRKMDSQTNPNPSAEDTSKHSDVMPRNSSGVESDNRNSCSREQRSVRSLTQTTPPYPGPTRETSAPVPEKTLGFNRIRPIPLDDKANPLRFPLLNLDGPPELTDKLGNASGSNNSTKKRKRRKKKKKAQMKVHAEDNMQVRILNLP